MKAILWVLLVGVSLGAGLPAEARRVQLEPSSITSLGSGEYGETRILLQFSLSSLVPGQSRKINWAHLEWAPTVSGAASSHFSAHEVVALSSGPGASAVTLAEEEASAWEVTPNEHARDDGARVRLEVTDIVRAWNNGEPALGIVIATPSMSIEDVNRQIESIRLIVSYGFRP